MKTPFRLRLFEAITKAIEEVNPDNGYEADLRGRVYRGRLLFGDEQELPCVSILQPPIPLDELFMRDQRTTSVGNIEVMVQGIVDEDHLHPTDPAERLMAEVKLALVKEAKRKTGMGDPLIFGMDGRVDGISIGMGSCRPPDMMSDRSFFWLTLTIKLVEDYADPYR